MLNIVFIGENIPADVHIEFCSNAMQPSVGGLEPATETFSSPEEAEGYLSAHDDVMVVFDTLSDIKTIQAIEKKLGKNFRRVYVFDGNNKQVKRDCRDLGIDRNSFYRFSSSVDDANGRSVGMFETRVARLFLGRQVAHAA